MSQQACVHTVSSWIIYASFDICGLYTKLAGIYTIKVSKMLNTMITLKAKMKPWSWWFTELHGSFSSVLNAGVCRLSAKRHRICGFLMKHSHRPTSFLFSPYSLLKGSFFKIAFYRLDSQTIMCGLQLKRGGRWKSLKWTIFSYIGSLFWS